MWVVGYMYTNELGRTVFVRHSAWDTQSEADHQRTVLEEHGYRSVQVDQDLTVLIENGHYYV